MESITLYCLHPTISLYTVTFLLTAHRHSVGGQYSFFRNRLPVCLTVVRRLGEVTRAPKEYLTPAEELYQ